jgi:hypothetical protein
VKMIARWPFTKPSFGTILGRGVFIVTPPKDGRDRR